MGVTGLWQILQPCARPIKIETLNRKRLAVDASIWIYQFLKAVRDKEGNALRNSHVVGFFRRICKLLFFGIKPVFVFDGGAPALKRQTITGRKRRREGRRDDAVRTAGKLLAVQMQRRAEQEDDERRKETRHSAQAEEIVPDEGLVYVDELQMSQQERQQNRKFRKKDAYHLPELDISMNEMGGPNDPRVMSIEELQQYAKQFEQGEDVNVYDFSKIDFDSPFFTSLPASDRYNILNAARLRSRLRMGHTKEQLDTMFPDRMEFSRFQIERVSERNELTTRLMNINEGDAAYAAGGIGTGSNRVAGEKAREYVLVKNEGVEGGWALGVIGEDGTKQETAIDLDRPAPALKVEESDDEEGFEDVPIEGLNRLPKRRKLNLEVGDAPTRQAHPSHKSKQRRSSQVPRRKSQSKDPDSLFVADDSSDEDEEGDWQDLDTSADLFGDDGEPQEDEELRRAIALSLEGEHADAPATSQRNEAESQAPQNDDNMLEDFQQRAAAEARPVPQGSARAIANLLNKRAHDVAPDSQETTSFGVPVPKAPEHHDKEDTSDLQAALAERQRRKRKNSLSPNAQMRVAQQVTARPQKPEETVKESGYEGPLPFEKLDLGTSLLGRKKMKERVEETAGGFEHPAAIEQQKRGEPLPPWFSGNVEKDLEKQRGMEREDRQRAREFNKQFMFQTREAPTLRRNPTGEVIDLEASDADESNSAREETRDNIDIDTGEAGVIGILGQTGNEEVDRDVRMGDVANAVRAAPPSPPLRDQRHAEARTNRTGPFEIDSDDEEEGDQDKSRAMQISHQAHSADGEISKGMKEVEDDIEWSESGDERRADPSDERPSDAVIPEGSKEVATDDGFKPVSTPSEDFQAQLLTDTAPRQPSRSPSAEFEDVDLAARPQRLREGSPPPGLPADDDDERSGPSTVGLTQNDAVSEVDGDDFDDFYDPEEEQLLDALAQEAEEHARFASSLNNKTPAQNILDYENELKQLRNQQKKDRRDADEVTHIMVQECQQLLRLFGLPYVTAPMEAEAQCAEMVKLGLVDGIVTDDSDCFLFGGTRIYKNMFNQAKFVECYLTSDLEKEFNLTRHKLIAIAQLLGSDYTEGLQGVGPVTALEILGEFQSLEGFRDWWNGVQMQTIPREADSDRPFRKKFRKNAMKLFLPPSFPDPRVEMAYVEPEVDADPEQFQWGVPDLDALRSFLMSTIGWSQERTDEVLVPVIKDMNRRADEGTQSNLTAFFEGGVGIGAAGAKRGEAFAPRKRLEGSKRMGQALGRMALQRGEVGTEQTPEQEQLAEQGDDREVAAEGTARHAPKKRRGRKQTAAAPVASDESASDFGESRKKPRRTGAGSKGTKGQRKQQVATENE
ncbi:hypothetical protein B0A50_01600 [Salinomyces thailandicus]|uniref:Uncharacterized protein n=1 Tax=Salinomyces thailandicus TaxID=706561 RepID=A0A4U0UCQ0_9PEZI|nr:hypothetical protein B0A50_01600 [Salinomyces thailandica]